MNIFPVILSGGYGTRLWPLSRQDYPKQLLALTGDETLFQQSVARMNQIFGESYPVLVICNHAHRFLIAEQLRVMQKTAKIILEPVGKNTAPALTLSAIHISETKDDGILLIMPADHVILDTEAFAEAIERGKTLAESGRMVTFGVVPKTPETGYGYILKADPIGDSAFEIAKFVEKPDLETAKDYLASGQYLWNSGMFMVRASVWYDTLLKLQPEIASHCYEAYLKGKEDEAFYHIDKAVFSSCPSDSIDYAIMEKIDTNQSAVIPLDAGWSDIGSWSSLWEISAQDKAGNAITGDVLTYNTKNSLIFSQYRLISTVGIENLVIVENADSILIMNKADAQDVKKITEELKKRKRSEYQFHRKVHRPWGSFDNLEEGSNFKVKRLTIKPGASISLQMHLHRAEHWVVVQGTAKVICGDKTFILTENQSTFIPQTMKHRLENPGSIMLEIIEVQSGNYLGEDDIIRYEDQYNRGTSE